LKKIFGKTAKEETLEEVTQRMRSDIEIISRLVQINPSLEFQNFIAQYISLFDDWEAAERLFRHWEYLNAFRDTFGQIPPPSTDIFRIRAPKR